MEFLNDFDLKINVTVLVRLDIIFKFESDDLHELLKERKITKIYSVLVSGNLINKISFLII